MTSPDLDALNAAMQIPEAAQTMEIDGVIADSLVILIEASTADAPLRRPLG
jgi:hypothetical protein